jgi:hypothetical protein
MKHELYEWEVTINFTLQAQNQQPGSGPKYSHSIKLKGSEEKMITHVVLDYNTHITDLLAKKSLARQTLGTITIQTKNQQHATAPLGLERRNQIAQKLADEIRRKIEQKQ